MDETSRSDGRFVQLAFEADRHSAAVLARLYERLIGAISQRPVQHGSVQIDVQACVSRAKERVVR